jgi:hypothetical protein
MVVLMKSGTKTKLYELVSQIAWVHVLFFLVLNVHIPLYLGARRKSFFQTSVFFVHYFQYQLYQLGRKEYLHVCVCVCLSVCVCVCK